MVFKEFLNNANKYAIVLQLHHWVYQFMITNYDHQEIYYSLKF